MTPEEPTYIVVQQPAAPKPKRKLPRVAVLAIMAVLVAGAGAGTFASFSASTSNNATFATGSLVLSNKVNAAATCFSTGAATNTDVNDQTCTSLFGTTNGAPGDLATANITLKNEGSINGSKLQNWVSSACVTTTNSIATYTGTGDLCSILQFTIQEYSDANRTVVSSCWYGNTAVANTCDFNDTAKSIGAYQSAHSAVGNATDLGAFTSQASRYLTVAVKVPSTATNSMQGRVATFSLKWNLAQ